MGWGAALLKPQKYVSPREMRSMSSGGPIAFAFVLSPEGSCESRTEGGPIVFTYVLIVGIAKIYDTFKI